MLAVNLSNPTGGHIVDGQGLGTITDDDSSPTADSQSVTTDEDTALPVTLAATGDGDPLTYTIVNAPGHGTLAGSGASQTYSPEPNYNGPDSFTFRASDGVNDSNLATVSITVNSVNDPPVASPNSALLAEDSFALVPLPATDADGDPLTYSIVEQPAHGALSGSGASRTYTPAPNYNGPDSFTFEANDGTTDSNTATVSLTVLPVNDAPVAVNDAASVAEDGSIPVAVLANDSDVDGDALSVTSVGTPAHGIAVLQEDGTVLYTPAANYNGGDSFTYAISDGSGGTDSASVALTVTPVNDAPAATDSSAQVAEDSPEDVQLHATDIDGDPLTYAIVTPPAHGTLSGSGATRTYTPDHHYSGPDSFTFKANDGTVDSNVATVSITVTRRDPATVNITDVSTQEGDAGETDAVFTVSISQPPTDTVVIDAASTDGTAHEPGDYGAMTTRLTFDPGQSSKTVVVKVHGDTLDEPDENYLVNLTVVSGEVVLGDGQGEGTIVDDDPLAGLAVGDTSVTEGNSGTTTASFAVTLSSASGKTVSVDWHTADGTAQAPSDYSSTGGTLTFDPGQTTKLVSVSVNGDTQIEPDETFLVQLTNEANATVEDGTGVGRSSTTIPPARRLHRRRPAATSTAPAATSSAASTASAATPACSARLAGAADDPRLPLHDHGHAQARRSHGDEAPRRDLRAWRERHAARARRKRCADRRRRQRPARGRPRQGPPDRRARGGPDARAQGRGSHARRGWRRSHGRRQRRRPPRRRAGRRLPERRPRRATCSWAIAATTTSSGSTPPDRLRGGAGTDLCRTKGVAICP